MDFMGPSVVGLGRLLLAVVVVVLPDTPADIVEIIMMV